MHLPQVIRRKLGRERALGLHWNDGVIEVDVRLRGRVALSTLLHEGLHHALPNLSERRVNETACMLARLLWRDGYRRIDK